MPTTQRQYSFAVKLWTGRSWIWPIEGRNLDWTNRISRKLRLADRARRDGRRNLPYKDDTELNLTQDQVLVRCRDGAQSLNNELSKRLDRAEQLIADRKPDRLVPKEIVDRLRQRILTDWATGEDRSIEIRQRARQRFQDLKSFQDKHDLETDALYPDPWPPFIIVVAIVAALVVETAVNSGLFARVNVDYLRGGILQAVAFSAVNILLGFFGLGLISARYTAHRRLLSKIAGWTGSTVTGFAGIAWNLYIAHFRELAARAPTGSTDYFAAASQTVQHPFQLGSWEAITLFFIGVAIFAFLAIEGYQRFDDPYPGYGTIDRRYRRAFQDYERQKAKLWAQGLATIKTERSLLAKNLAIETANLVEMREIKVEAEAAQRDFEESGKALGRAVNELLKQYRAVNQAVRTAPPPAYFTVEQSLPVPLPNRSDDIANALESASATLDSNTLAARETAGMFVALEADMKTEFEAFVAHVELRAEQKDDKDNAGSIFQRPFRGDDGAGPHPGTTNGSGQPRNDGGAGDAPPPGPKD